MLAKIFLKTPFRSAKRCSHLSSADKIKNDFDETCKVLETYSHSEEQKLTSSIIKQPFFYKKSAFFSNQAEKLIPNSLPLSNEKNKKYYLGLFLLLLLTSWVSFQKKTLADALNVSKDKGDLTERSDIWEMLFKALVEASHISNKHKDNKEKIADEIDQAILDDPKNSYLQFLKIISLFIKELGIDPVIIMDKSSYINSTLLSYLFNNIPLSFRAGLLKESAEEVLNYLNKVDLPEYPWFVGIVKMIFLLQLEQREEFYTAASQFFREEYEEWMLSAFISLLVRPDTYYQDFNLLKEIELIEKSAVPMSTKALFCSILAYELSDFEKRNFSLNAALSYGKKAYWLKSINDFLASDAFASQGDSLLENYSEPIKSKGFYNSGKLSYFIALLMEFYIKKDDSQITLKNFDKIDRYFSTEKPLKFLLNIIHVFLLARIAPQRALEECDVIAKGLGQEPFVAPTLVKDFLTGIPSHELPSLLAFINLLKASIALFDNNQSLFLTYMDEAIKSNKSEAFYSTSTFHFTKFIFAYFYFGLGVSALPMLDASADSLPDGNVYRIIPYAVNLFIQKIAGKELEDLQSYINNLLDKTENINLLIWIYLLNELLYTSFKEEEKLKELAKKIISLVKDDNLISLVHSFNAACLYQLNPLGSCAYALEALDKKLLYLCWYYYKPPDFQLVEQFNGIVAIDKKIELSNILGNLFLCLLIASNKYLHIEAKESALVLTYIIRNYLSINGENILFTNTFSKILKDGLVLHLCDFSIVSLICELCLDREFYKKASDLSDAWLDRHFGFRNYYFLYYKIIAMIGLNQVEDAVREIYFFRGAFPDDKEKLMLSYLEALIYYVKADYDNAIKIIDNEVLKINQDYIKAFSLKAAIFLKIYDSADKSSVSSWEEKINNILQAGYTLDPDDPYLKLIDAKLLTKKGELEAALEVFQEVNKKFGFSIAKFYCNYIKILLNKENGECEKALRGIESFKQTNIFNKEELQSLESLEESLKYLSTLKNARRLPEEIVIAINEGNTQKVEEFLNENPHFINYKAQDGTTMLNMVIQKGDNLLFSKLLGLHSATQLPNDDGETPLSLAIKGAMREDKTLQPKYSEFAETLVANDFQLTSDDIENWLSNLDAKKKDELDSEFYIGLSLNTESIIQANFQGICKELGAKKWRELARHLTNQREPNFGISKEDLISQLCTSPFNEWSNPRIYLPISILSDVSSYLSASDKDEKKKIRDEIRHQAITLAFYREIFEIRKARKAREIFEIREAAGALHTSLLEKHVKKLMRYIERLSDGESLTYLAGGNGHFVYINIGCTKNNLIVRLDNLGTGVEKHTMRKFDLSNGEQVKQYRPCVIRKFPYEETEWATAREELSQYLKEICNRWGVDAAQEAESVYYDKPCLGCEEHDFEYPQEKENCLIRNQVVGRKIRLETDLYQRLEQECTDLVTAFARRPGEFLPQNSPLSGLDTILTMDDVSDAVKSFSSVFDTSKKGFPYFLKNYHPGIDNVEPTSQDFDEAGGEFQRFSFK